MSEIVLSVEVRDRTGKGGAREARRGGNVPGVLYGGGLGPVAINLRANELTKAINSGKLLNHMIEISHKGDKQSVIARDVQFHPVRDIPMHVDFYRVDKDSVITVEVLVQFINEELSPALKRGAVLNVVRHEVEVECPAGQIPEHIVVDLTGFEVGDSIHISHVTLPENVTPTITDRDFTIATIQMSRAGSDSADEEADDQVEGDEDGDEDESED